MTSIKTILTRVGLDTLYFSSIYRLLEPAWGGLGVIFTLHHVVPSRAEPTPAFAPNQILDITSEFLEQTIQQVQELDIDIVDLDEARRRLLADGTQRRLVCFTLDDGYKDNFSTALPIFKKYNAPFAVYVTTGICLDSACFEVANNARSNTLGCLIMNKILHMAK